MHVSVNICCTALCLELSALFLSSQTILPIYKVPKKRNKTGLYGQNTHTVTFILINLLLLTPEVKQLCKNFYSMAGILIRSVIRNFHSRERLDFKIFYTDLKLSWQEAFEFCSLHIFAKI